MLATAEDILAHEGLEALGMRELARRSRVPIASLYEYFVDRRGVVEALARRQLEAQSAMLLSRLDGTAVAPGDLATIGRLVDEVTDAMAHFQRDNPAYLAIWTSASAMGELLVLDQLDTRANATLMAPLLERALPRLGAPGAWHLALTICNGTGSTLRYALTLDKPEAQGVVAAWKAMVKASCAQFA